VPDLWGHDGVQLDGPFRSDERGREQSRPLILFIWIRRSYGGDLRVHPDLDPMPRVHGESEGELLDGDLLGGGQGEGDRMGSGDANHGVGGTGSKGGSGDCAGGGATQGVVTLVVLVREYTH